MQQSEQTMDHLTIITATRNRPRGIELAGRWMRNQSYSGPVRWIIVDDGEDRCEAPTVKTNWIVEVIRRDVETNEIASFTGNLETGISAVDAESNTVAIIEDDDYYRPEYLEFMLKEMHDSQVSLVGIKALHYYNLRDKLYVPIVPMCAAMCTTCFKRTMFSPFRWSLRHAKRMQTIDVDFILWTSAAIQLPHKYVFPSRAINIGMKCIPGRRRIGALGWKVDESQKDKYHIDRDGTILRRLIGIEEDAQIYLDLIKEIEADVKAAASHGA